MFASSVIRKLARSEEMFAETHNFVGLGAHLKARRHRRAVGGRRCTARGAPLLAATLSVAPTGGISSSSMT